MNNFFCIFYILKEETKITTSCWYAFLNFNAVIYLNFRNLENESYFENIKNRIFFFNDKRFSDPLYVTCGAIDASPLIR